MRKLFGLLQGPYRNEAAFKRAYLFYIRNTCATHTFFEIENPEKSPGMPDVLAISNTLPAYFIECKFVRKDGYAIFQPSQPLWYKRNSHLRIDILAWDSRDSSIAVIDHKEVVKQKAVRIRVPLAFAQSSLPIERRYKK